MPINSFLVKASTKASISILIASSCGVNPAQAFQAITLIDNTNIKTATLGSSGSQLSTLNTKQGVEFRVGAGYTAQLDSVTLGIGANGTSPTNPFVVELWNAGGTSPIGSQPFDLPSGASSYNEYSLSSTFSGLTQGNYYLTVSSANLNWSNTDPLADPSAPATGFEFVQYRRSTNAGTTWGSTGNKNSILLQGTITQNTPAVPGPLPLFGLGAAFTWSRRLRRRVVKHASSK